MCVCVARFPKINNMKWLCATFLRSQCFYGDIFMQIRNPHKMNATFVFSSSFFFTAIFIRWGLDTKYNQNVIFLCRWSYRHCAEVVAFSGLFFVFAFLSIWYFHVWHKMWGFAVFVWLLIFSLSQSYCYFCIVIRIRFIGCVCVLITKSEFILFMCNKHRVYRRLMLLLLLLLYAKHKPAHCFGQQSKMRTFSSKLDTEANRNWFNRLALVER